MDSLLVTLGAIQKNRVRRQKCCYRSSAAVLGQKFMQRQGLVSDCTSVAASGRERLALCTTKFQRFRCWSIFLFQVEGSHAVFFLQMLGIVRTYIDSHAHCHRPLLYIELYLTYCTMQLTVRTVRTNTVRTLLDKFTTQVSFLTPLALLLNRSSLSTVTLLIIFD